MENKKETIDEKENRDDRKETKEDNKDKIVRMNTISGKVVLQQIHIGIPNLLVVLYDVDPNTKPEEILTRIDGIPVGTNHNHSLNGLGDRIGSVLTEDNGSFSLTYEDREYRIRNEEEKRPDLLLLVMAPEALGKALKDIILFASVEVRQNAGRIESYFIELTATQLEQAGLPIPQNGGVGGGDPVEEDLQIFTAMLDSRFRFFGGKAKIVQETIEQEHAKHAAERTANFSVNVKEELSRVPKSVRESDYFVAEGESVWEKVDKNIRNQIETTFNGAGDGPILLRAQAGENEPVRRPLSAGFIYLTPAQIAEYQPHKQGDEFVLPTEIIERDILPQLFGGNSQDGSANDFLMNHPAVRLCMGIMRDDPGCKVDSQPPEETEETEEQEPEEEGEQTEEPAPEEPGDQGPILFIQANETSLELNNAKDVFPLIARQMELMNAPEGTVNFGIDPKKRAEAADIAESVGKLQFEKGPADVPAFFDFHILHLALDHVWKEAIDKNILRESEDAYDELGGTGTLPVNLKGLVAELSSKTSFLRSRVQREPSPPPVEVVMEFPDAVKVWDKLIANEQTVLKKLADAILQKYEHSSDWKNFLNGTRTTPPFINKGHLIDSGAMEAIAIFRQRGQQILDNVYERLEEGQEVQSELESYKRAAALVKSLNQKLRERYSFTYFAADDAERGVNFGIVLTYRQKWEPVNYQAGELVRTIPLAPKEVRKYSKRTVIKKNRSEKEIEDNLRILKTDTADTSRAEVEIVNKAFNKSTFELNTTANFEVGLGEMAKMSGSVNNKTTNEAIRESNQTKKDFREAVIKAAQEHKNERRTEITTETFYESEETESGEICNPNDELTCTFLFYELQRVFKINERMHRMRPVILIAQEMPAPHEIDDAWIIRHDWILKRALMDDSFLYAFDCVTHIRGDRLMLEELERSAQEQRKIVRDLRQNVKFYTEETGRLSRLFQAAISREAGIVEGRDAWDSIPLLGGALDSAEGAISGVGKIFGFGGSDDNPTDAARIRREAAKDAYERAERERRELIGRLEQEVGVLNGLTRQVAEKHKEINEKELLIVRLKNHLKDHILHYMQTIWSYEHPDQRFFRLFNTKVPHFTPQAGQYNLHIATEPTPARVFDVVVNLDQEDTAQKTRHAFTFSPMINVEEKTLAEVAELDNLLGFKGNYMIFPLKNSNVLTDFMMAPYVDSEFGLLDPDAVGNWTLEEFDQLYCCLREKLGDRFSELETDLKEFYRQILLDPLRPGEIITVPTGSLFIEALPGKHPIMEDFKLLHRAVDVKKVQAEVRKMEMENIRYAARILDGKHEDPEIERKIVVQGDGQNVIVPPDN